MAKGSQSKELITKALLQVFPGAFMDADGKTIRIPSKAEGDVIEIKVALTAAKDVVGGSPVVEVNSNTVQPQDRELTAQEIEDVRKLIADLGL